MYGYANSIDGMKQLPHISTLRSTYYGEEILDLIPKFLGHSYDDVNAWIKDKVSIRAGKEHTALWRIMLDAELINRYRLRFDLNLSLGEDTKFINEYLLRETSVGYLDKCLYYLTFRPNGANWTSLSDPIRMMNDKIKLIKAREEIDKIALELYGIDTRPYWSGTIVLSAVQLALKFAKNKESSFKQNLKNYAVYMSLPETKVCMREFRPCFGIKALPFIIVKRNWKLFLIIARVIPYNIVDKLMGYRYLNKHLRLR